MFNYGIFPFADILCSQRFAYDGSNNVEYIGYAKPGASSFEDLWAICKYTYSGSNVVAKQWAGGSNLQNKIWENRASYSYS